MIVQDMLLESLFRNDLENMVLPLVSFDEFESKVKKNALVIGFYVKNEEAATDLALFLDRSTIDVILDAEVSPITNEDGNFMVFVEVDNSSTIKDIWKIFEITKHLTGDIKFNIRAYKMNKVYPLTYNNLKVLLDKVKKEYT